VAKAILQRIAAEFEYIDITGYIGDGANRYDDETWEKLARIAADAAVAAVVENQEPPEDAIAWNVCQHCDVPIFRHATWSHQGGTPPVDHEAEPRAPHFR
jgi:hypothetical protein